MRESFYRPGKSMWGEWRECPGSVRVTHFRCLHKAGEAGISKVTLFGGHFCWAFVYLEFHCLDLKVMIFAPGWKSLLLLWRSPGATLYYCQKNQVPRAQISPPLPLPLASGGQFSFLQHSFPGCGRGSSSTGTVGTGWYGNVLRATTAWKHMVIIH